MPRSRVTLPQVRIWLVGRGKPRRWKHRGIAMCGITGDKDGCATLVQSASKTSVCRYYSRHPLLDGGNKKKSVPRSHWVYASLAYGGPMFLGLLAAPDLFADDRVLLSYLAITDDIGRIFFFLFPLFLFLFPTGENL